MRVAAVLILAVMVASLLAVPEPSLHWRLLAVLLTLALCARPLSELLWLHGARAVRSFVWTGDGTWWLTDGSGRRQRARLDPATGMFGPLVFLAWSVEGRPRRVVLDSACADGRTLRALRGRLRIKGARQLRRGVEEG